MVGIISVVIGGGHFGGEDHFDGGDHLSHFGGGTALNEVLWPRHTPWETGIHQPRFKYFEQTKGPFAIAELCELSRVTRVFVQKCQNFRLKDAISENFMEIVLRVSKEFKTKK